MVTYTGPSLSEAMIRFISTKKGRAKAAEGQQELGRFVTWCGRDRNVCDLSPSEVADYAQYIGQRGSESVQKLTPVKAFLGFLKDEGWVQTGLASHLRVPRTRRAAGRRGSGSAASAGTLLSQEGYDRLVLQLEGLKVERVTVVDDIRLAMADKDFRENAPLEAAKEHQGIIEARIRELEATLATVQILGPDSKIVRHRTALGTSVTLKDVSSGKELVYKLVDVKEADAASGKISTQSPVGQALLDRAVGDEVTVNVPRGTVQYVVQKIAG